MNPEPGFIRVHFYSILLLMCAVVAVYANALRGDFQFDDFNVIVNNPRVHSWPAWWHDLQHGIRPLLKLTYTLDWTSSIGTLGFHLTNVLIHLCNTLLVLLLSRHFVARQADLQALPNVPLFAALLFAVHPVHTEAVTYICGRSSALMTLFYLAGMLFYIAGKSRHRQLYLHVLTPLCMVLALGVKETAVTFPLALLLWELYNGGSIRSALREQWSSWLLLCASSVFFLFHTGYGSMVENSAALNSVSGNVATQTVAFVYLLRQWLFPLWLNIDPDLRLLHDFTGVLPYVIVLALLLLLTLIASQRRPWFSFAFAWTALQLLPLYLFLPRTDIANERQLYLASWPLALAVAAELSLWLRPHAFKWIAALIIIIMMSLTMMRNQDYRNELTLWEATVKLSPDKARVQNNLGYAYMLAGKKDQAKIAFETALQLDSTYYKARFNLLRLNETNIRN